jgi:hypothetical protein
MRKFSSEFYAIISEFFSHGNNSHPPQTTKHEFMLGTGKLLLMLFHQEERERKEKCKSMIGRPNEGFNLAQ